MHKLLQNARVVAMAVLMAGVRLHHQTLRPSFKRYLKTTRAVS